MGGDAVLSVDCFNQTFKHVTSSPASKGGDPYNGNLTLDEHSEYQGNIQLVTGDGPQRRTDTDVVGAVENARPRGITSWSVSNRRILTVHTYRTAPASSRPRPSVVARVSRVDTRSARVLMYTTLSSGNNVNFTAFRSYTASTFELS